MSELEHFGNEIYAIETRINRLAIACGVDLGNELHVNAVRQGNFTFCANGDHHTHLLLQELLLLLDYVTVHCSDERGAAECRRIVAEVATRLRRERYGG